MSSYTHDSYSGLIEIRESETQTYGGYAVVKIKGTSAMLLPPEERQAAAQALAGDEWGVVPAKAAMVDPDSLDLMHEDLGRILDALSLGDHARPYSPHECVTRDVLPAIDRMKAERAKLGREHDALLDQLHDAETQAAQPDRPEPVDPADIARAKAEALREAVAMISNPYAQSVLETAAKRYDREAEPELDPAAVEALASTVHIALATVGPPEEDDDWRKWSGRIANLLAREGYVVSTDA